MRIVEPIPKRTERKKKRRKNVMCLVSYVACHLLLMSTAKATDPPPANSPIMHSRLVRKDPEPEKISKHKKSLEKKLAGRT